MAGDGDQLLHSLGLTEHRPLRLNLGRGRTTHPLTFEVSRNLSVEDLIAKGSAEQSTKAPPLKELRVQHHSIAKMLAQGHKPGAISAILGIGAARISILQADEAFKELLAYYQDMSQKEFAATEADMAKMLHGLGVDSISVLHERLLEEPEKFSPKELASIIQLTADRSGFGPTATVNNNVTHSLDADTLARIRGASDGSAQPQALGEEDRGSLLRLAVSSTDLHPEAQEVTWEPSEGGGVREEGGEDAVEEVAGPGSLSTVVDFPGAGESD